MNRLVCVCAPLAVVASALSLANGQQWQSPATGGMSATYDSSGAVTLPEPGYAPGGGGAAWSSSRRDPAVRPAAVHQPAGRVYAVRDPFAVSAPQSTPVAQPAWGAPATSAPANTAPAYGQGGYATGGYSQPSYAQPGYSTQGFAQPGYSAPAQGANIAPCPPMDAYACPPSYSYQAPAAITQAPLAPSGQLRQAYSELEGRFGDPAETLQSNLFLPFCQQSDRFWFFDLRGQYDDERAGEGNFGIARRQLITPERIMGFYAFYDLRHSRFDNNFHQLTTGFELLTLDWEYRVNGYLPFTGTQPTGQNVASLVDDNIVVQQGLERAYNGVDAEFGRVLARFGGPNDHEVRGFLGGYYFDTDAPAFASLGGPRARLEGRCYDLPLLGAGSRFTYGATYQWDDVRESQWIAFANIRIPFGRGGRPAGSKLTPMERRMLSPIRRDEAIVTGGALGEPEQAVISSTGVVATGITEIASSASAATDVANGSNIAVVTADINTTDTIVLNPDQFLGGQFLVEGQDSGAQAIFGAPRTVNGAGVDTIQIANNSTVTGLTVTGDQRGIVGGADDTALPPDGDADPDGVNGFTISNNTVTVTGGDAIELEGAIHGDITGNSLNSTAADGLDVDQFASGQISANTSSDNSGRGFLLGAMSGGTISDNVASGNGIDGFLVNGELSGGTIAGNVANGNSDDGFDFDEISGGTVSGNTASGNDDDGFEFDGDITGGAITGNLASDNNVGDSGFGGFNFFSENDAAAAPDVSISGAAVVAGNMATGNGRDGFAFGAVEGGEIFDNAATDNNASEDGVGGFRFFNVTGGEITENAASSNTFDGFFFNTINGAGVLVSENTATGNTDDGFEIAMFDNGAFNDNVANDNDAIGYNFPTTPPDPPATAAGNTGSGNGSVDEFP